MMKKVALSLAGVMAAATFAPQASALPVFARQTGMACNACHFQHFPMLNAFGRSFKASGFTLMGAEGKVEGENLSIPNVLNAAILTTAGYTKTNQTGATGTAAAAGIKGVGDGAVYVPGTNGEFSLFVGGRTSDNSGALAEIGLLQNGGVGAGIASAKIPMLWDMNGTRVGIVPFTTDGQGASYGFEELNTGANAVHTMLFAGGDFNGSLGTTVSAQQYIGTATTATGAAFVAANSMGFINITKFHQVGPADLGGAGAKLGSTYLRVAGTFDLSGWDSAVGIQSWSGSSTNAPTTTVGPFSISDTKATAIDGQMQGELGGMPVGFYASYARAPSVTPVAGGTIGNAYNPGGTATKSAFVFSTEVGVIPEKATLGFGIRRGKSGGNAGTLIAGSNDTDNSYLLEGSYKLAQNMMLQLVYTHQSGSFWSTANKNAIGSNQTALNLATIF
jgi:hypothetical protein